MAVQRGRGVRVEISKTISAAKVVSTVTLADPPVATSTAHGLTDGAAGYFANVSGMAELELQAIRADATATNTLNLEGIDATDYGAFTSGSLYAVTAWSTLSKATDITVGGGEPEKEDVTVLLDTKKKEEISQQAAETATIAVRADMQEEAIKLIRKSGKKGSYHVFRVTFPDGEQWLFVGQPSPPGASIATGQLATGSISVAVKGDILFLPAVA